jgi:hypothetical protein
MSEKKQHHIMGSMAATTFAIQLIDKSISFEMEPWPEDTWMLYYKPEAEHIIKELAEQMVNWV